MDQELQKILAFFRQTQDISDKSKLLAKFQLTFHPSRERKIYRTKNGISIRFCSTKSTTGHASNTVLALSKIKQLDDLPILVILVTPQHNFVKIMNSTFISKVSHSSKNLTQTHIVGSINYGDILSEFNGINNNIDNVVALYNIHQQNSFYQNLIRIVNATHQIKPHKKAFVPNNAVSIHNIMNAINRANEFLKSNQYQALYNNLEKRVQHNKVAIYKAAQLDNVNIRGRIIELLVTSDDQALIFNIKSDLAQNKVPKITTRDRLADYSVKLNNWQIGIDIKSKLMSKDSNPKAFSIDDMLEFLSQDNTVFFFFFVGIDTDSTIISKLIPAFDQGLMTNARICTSWSGLAQRGHIQFDGQFIHKMLLSPYKTKLQGKTVAQRQLKNWLQLK